MSHDQLRVHDRARNVTTESRSVIIDLRPPPVPEITAPADGLVVAQGPVTVRGTAEPLTSVRLTRNGFVVANPVAAEDGRWVASDVPLDQEGEARFVATAEDSVGVSAGSNPVSVVLDSGAPAAPILQAPIADPSFGVTLRWRFADEGERPSRFRIYRHTVPFSDAAEAAYLGETADLSFQDRRPPNATLIYALVGLDAADNASPLSNREAVTYDNQPPVLAVEIAMDHASPFGPGPVSLRLVSNEVLAEPPTLTVMPPGGGLVPIELTADGELAHVGLFEITPQMPSGVAVIEASAIDTFGNRFAGRPSGPSLALDTQGPSGAVVVDAVEPVQVLETTDVGISLTLDEAAGVESVPMLEFEPPAGAVARVPLLGSGETWQGVLTLQSDMGSGYGQFRLQVRDRFGNLGQSITSGEPLEIYNTPVPTPTDPPAGLRASTLPGGEIRLSWSEIDRAETYTIYRAAGLCMDVQPDGLIASDVATSPFVDLPPEDGSWCYTVTALRRGAESEPSNRAGTFADRVPPSPPRNVDVGADTRGVQITWQVPNTGDLPHHYEVERNGVKIRTVNQRVGHLNHVINDHPPLGGIYAYVVKSVDAVGNAAASEPVSYELLVGAVIGLEAFVSGDNVPLVSWASGDPSTVGYNVYRDQRQLNAELLVAPTFEDHAYAGASRARYAVTAVNAQQEESPRRMVEVFPVVIGATVNADADGDAQPLVTGYFNRLDITVTNADLGAALPVTRIETQVTVNGDEELAALHPAPGDIPAGGTLDDTFIVPLGHQLAARIARIQVIQIDEAGTIAIYERTVPFEQVTHTAAPIELTIDDIPLAGGESVVRLCINNYGYADMDVVAARNHGTAPGDIDLVIQNEQGLAIARTDYQGYPEGAWQLGSTGFLHIPPGEQACADVPIIVPESLEAGARLTFEGIVTDFAYALPTVALPGVGPLTGRMGSGITLSTYHGTTELERYGYANDDVVVITGQALDRTTGEPVPEVPLRLGFFTRGFRWYEEVTTDETGAYRFEYDPMAGVAGVMTLWAAHPDVVDTIRQSEFALYRLYTRPSNLSITSSKADTLSFRISLVNIGDTPLTGIAVTTRAYVTDEQGEATDIDSVRGAGIVPDDFSIAAGGARIPLELQLEADMDAPDVVNIDYTITTEQGARAVIRGVAQLRPAVPMLDIESPYTGYVQESVNRGTVFNVPVTVKNEGLRVLEDAVVTLPEQLRWITTNLPLNEQGGIDLGDIEVGASQTFDVVIAPDNDVAQGTYADFFVVTGANSVQALRVNTHVLVTSLERGSAEIYVINSFGHVIEGARVRLHNAHIRERAEATTNAEGVAVFEELAIGPWSYQVSAPGHRSTQSVIDVIAGQHTVEEVELRKSLVTITFTVEPVPFTDRYEIKIEQTFVTNVPEPVLVVDPPYREIRDVTPGFETTEIITISNFGLKAMDDVTLSTADDGLARLEPLISYIPRLAAMETIEVPMRITYRGESSELPGRVCGHPIGGADDSDPVNGAVNLSAIIMGRARSDISQKEREFYAKTAVGLLILGSADPITGGAIMLGSLIAWVGCKTGWWGDYGDDDGESEGSVGSNRGSARSRNAGGWGPNASLAAGGPGCFVAGTPITLPDGNTLPIERLRPGDRVAGLLGEPVVVTQTYTRHSTHIRELRYRVLGAELEGPDLKRLETTDEHRFRRRAGPWVKAGDLQVGDVIRLAGQRTAELMETRRLDAPITVYNFDVDQHHIYFANDALVYQKCGDAPQPSLPMELATSDLSQREVP